MRLRLDIAYDGTDFAGWAAQPGLRTVQGELEGWLGNVLRLAEPPRLTCAGRTDAGVHARGQVAHLDLPDDLDPATLVRHDTAGLDLPTLVARRLRRALPADVVVTRVSVAPEGFDARFSALERTYRYRLADAGSSPDPLARRHVVAWPDALDADAMNAAARPLLGLHDFGAFCKAREGATTIRALNALGTTRGDDGVLVTEVRADAFCHSMVRALMGALVAVGSGRKDLAWLEGLVDSPVRAGDNRVMPPHGLVLEHVAYPSDDQLAARAAEARATRTLPEEA